MKKLILGLLLMPVIIYSQAPLSVEEVIEIGLKNNFDIQIANKNSEIAANNARLGESGFLPSLDLSGNYNISKSDQETNSPFSLGSSTTNGWSGQVSLNWTLFDGFKMFVDNRRYKELEKLGEVQARNIIENSIVGILRSYFNLVQQELLLDVAENSVKVSEDRLEKARVRNDLGGASTTDLLNAQVSLNNDKAVMLERELNVQIARKELNILLGRNPAEPILIKKEISITDSELSQNDIAEMAKSRNASLLLAKQNKTLAEHNVDVSRSFYYPRVLLNGSYGYSDRTVATSSERVSGDVITTSTDGSIGLTLSFNIFNGFRNDIDIQSRIIESNIQELALKKAEHEIEGLVKEKYDTYIKRLEFINLEEKNVTAAEQNLTLQQDRFETGATSSLEFRDAQINLSRAQSALISAKYQARIVLLEIDQLTGNIRIN